MMRRSPWWRYAGGRPRPQRRRAATALPKQYRALPESPAGRPRGGSGNSGGWNRLGALSDSARRELATGEWHRNAAPEVPRQALDPEDPDAAYAGPEDFATVEDLVEHADAEEEAIAAMEGDVPLLQLARQFLGELASAADDDLDATNADAERMTDEDRRAQVREAQRAVFADFYMVQQLVTTPQAAHALVRRLDSPPATFVAAAPRLPLVRLCVHAQLARHARQHGALADLSPSPLRRDCFLVGARSGASGVESIFSAPPPPLALSSSSLSHRDEACAAVPAAADDDVARGFVGGEGGTDGAGMPSAGDELRNYSTARWLQRCIASSAVVESDVFAVLLPSLLDLRPTPARFSTEVVWDLTGNGDDGVGAASGFFGVTDDIVDYFGEENESVVVFTVRRPARRGPSPHAPPATETPQAPQVQHGKGPAVASADDGCCCGVGARGSIKALAAMLDAPSPPEVAASGAARHDVAPTCVILAPPTTRDGRRLRPGMGDADQRKNPAAGCAMDRFAAVIQELPQLHETQVRLLCDALALLRVEGGRLFYMTTSLNPLENEAVVCAALKKMEAAAVAAGAAAADENSDARPRRLCPHAVPLPSLLGRAGVATRGLEMWTPVEGVAASGDPATYDEALRKDVAAASLRLNPLSRGGSSSTSRGGVGAEEEARGVHGTYCCCIVLGELRSAERAVSSPNGGSHVGPDDAAVGAPLPLLVRNAVPRVASRPQWGSWPAGGRGNSTHRSSASSSSGGSTVVAISAAASQYAAALEARGVRLAAASVRRGGGGREPRSSTAVVLESRGRRLLGVDESGRAATGVSSLTAASVVLRWHYHHAVGCGRTNATDAAAHSSPLALHNLRTIDVGPLAALALLAARRVSAPALRGAARWLEGGAAAVVARGTKDGIVDFGLHGAAATFVRALRIKAPGAARAVLQQLARDLGAVADVADGAAQPGTRGEQALVLLQLSPKLSASFANAMAARPSAAEGQQHQEEEEEENALELDAALAEELRLFAVPLLVTPGPPPSATHPHGTAAAIACTLSAADHCAALDAVALTCRELGVPAALLADPTGPLAGMLKVGGRGAVREGSGALLHLSRWDEQGSGKVGRGSSEDNRRSVADVDIGFPASSSSSGMATTTGRSRDEDEDAMLAAIPPFQRRHLARLKRRAGGIEAFLEVEKQERE